MIDIIAGVIGGLAYSLSGLAKNKKRKKFLKDKKFNWKKMTPTLIIAGVVGGIAGYMNKDFSVLMNSSLGAGVTAIIQNIWKRINHILTYSHQ